MSYFAKKVRNFLVVSLVILTFCLLPMLSSSAVFASDDDTMTDYFQFDQALSKMLEDYDSMESDLVALASVEEETNNSTNRLIIETSQQLDDCGAVAKAEFKDYHIFQYSNYDDAENAYNFYNNLDNVEVGFDFVVSIDDLQEVDEIEVDSTYNYLSWGAKYVGYQTYVESMLSTSSQENLNEVVIAVVDSGINTSHYLFKDRILLDYGKNFTTETTTGYEFEDLNGHGTHVSGIIAESTLSNVKILPLKVLKSNGRGYVSSIVSAIEYAIELKSNGTLPNLKAMNMSIGVDDSSSVDSTETSSQSVGAYSTSLNNAVVSAYNKGKGILSVVSAGNENRNTSYAVPANVDCALTISALTEEYDFVTGKNLVFHGEWHDSAGYSNYGSHVDFCAPGSYIKSAYKGSSTTTATLSGTSMAAPHATAVVALIYSNPTYKDYDLEELVALLKENADKSDLYTSGVYAVSSSERDDYYGYGLISVKNIGLVTSGYVTFSETEEFPSKTVELELSYDGEIDSDAGEYAKIYYTTQEDVSALDINSSIAKLYSSAIEISSTTKVTAVACVYDKNNVLIRKSFSTSQVYYFDNFDLSINFVFEETSDGLIIKKYTGKLTALEIKDIIDGKTVVGIDEGAFNDSNVEILYLPAVSNFKIYNRAFYSYTKLLEIYASCTSLQIGNEAFRYCTNLAVANIENATTLGDYAFANDTSLEVLYLPKSVEVGQHAFSGSGIKNVVLGQNIETFKSQSSLSLTQIYGYSGTVAEDFAIANEIDFYDLTLTIKTDIAKRKIMRESDTVTLQFDFVAFRPSYEIETEITTLSSFLLGEGAYSYTLSITLSNMEEGENTLKINVVDYFGNKISSTEINIIVLDDAAETHTLNFEEDSFDVYVDDEKVTSSTVLFDGYDYVIKIIAKSGYEIDNVLVGTTEKESPIYITADEDIDLTVSTKEKEILTADFILDVGGKVIIDNNEVVSYDVERNQTLQFKVEPDAGYRIKYVKADGEILTANDGVYSIESVANDIVVEVEFELLRYEVALTYGKGGSVFRRGVFSNSSDIVYGSDLVFDIVCSDGYVVDFVKVNGVEIKVVDNTFTIENVDQDCDIVVSFKTASVSIFSSEYSTILRYFIVFFALFVLFILAKIGLMIYRKKKKNR